MVMCRAGLLGLWLSAHAVEWSRALVDATAGARVADARVRVRCSRKAGRAVSLSIGGRLRAPGAADWPAGGSCAGRFVQQSEPAELSSPNFTTPSSASPSLMGTPGSGNW